MVRPPKAKRSRQKTKRGLPVARPTKARGPSRSATAPSAPAALKQMLDSDALEKLGNLYAAQHVELTPEKLEDGNAFFFVTGHVFPRALPPFNYIKPSIVTNGTPIQIFYPTLGLEQRELVVECEGNWPGDVVEINVGEVLTLGDWSTSAEVTVKPKNGIVKFLADPTLVAPGHMLGISISSIERLEVGDGYFDKCNNFVKGPGLRHRDLTIRRCTIDQVEL